MAITGSQVPWRFTTAEGLKAAGSGPGSLGQYLSVTNLADASLHALFSEISPSQNANGWTDYRCIGVPNLSALTWATVKLYLGKVDSRGAAVAIGLDPAGVVNWEAAAVAQRIASPTTAPANVAFSTPTTEASGLALPANVAPGQAFAVWVRRTIKNGSEVDPESNLLVAAGTSPV